MSIEKALPGWWRLFYAHRAPCCRYRCSLETGDAQQISIRSGSAGIPSGKIGSSEQAKPGIRYTNSGMQV